jgi:hypothetical protein
VRAVTGQPGAIVLFGSGETAAVGREALRWLVATDRHPGSAAVLETPAGFEPNAAEVAGRWTRFLRRQPELNGAAFAQVPARRRGTPWSPDDPDLTRPILGADLMVLGAGSPSYAARQLRGSLAWQRVSAAHFLGASLFLASAAAVAAGTCALPVYEIYKVGEDPHWKDGLGLFDLYGLSLTLVTHWDNADGGVTLDTTRGYMGEARFRELVALLSPGVVVAGIDEHTALAIDPATAEGRVLGRGGVTIVRDGSETVFETGARLPLGELGPFAVPDVDAVLDPETRRAVEAARAEREAVARPPAEVRELIASRAQARAQRDWATADRLREEIAALGWDVEDRPGGPRLLPRRRA